MPLTTAFINPCKGELVTIEGTVFLNAHGTQDSASGLHGMFISKIQGVGVGESGARYVLTNEVISEASSAAEGATEVTQPLTLLSTARAIAVTMTSI